MFFGVFNFLQKTNENKSTGGIIVVESNSFVFFRGNRRHQKPFRNYLNFRGKKFLNYYLPPPLLRIYRPSYGEKPLMGTVTYMNTVIYSISLNNVRGHWLNSSNFKSTMIWIMFLFSCIIFFQRMGDNIQGRTIFK